MFRTVPTSIIRSFSL